MTDEEIVAALAEAMREARVGYYTTTAEILLPVVRRVAEQRAAEVVQPFLDLADEMDAIAVDARAVARGLDQHGFSARSDRNHYRADALSGAARHIRAAALTAAAPTPTRPARAPIDPPKPANYHPYA